MSIKHKMRLAADLTMTVMFPLLMAYSLVGERLHEWLGISMTALFILHQALNLSWYRNLLKGPYPAYRVVMTIVNVLLLTALLLLFYSGGDLSRHLLPLLPESGSASLSRILHLSASRWAMLLMSFHLGLHMNRFTGPLHHRKSSKAVSALPVRLIAVYGVYAFFAVDFPSYLIASAPLMFFDAGQPLIKNLGESLSVMTLFVLLGSQSAKLLQTNHLKKRRTEK